VFNVVNVVDVLQYYFNIAATLTINIDLTLKKHSHLNIQHCNVSAMFFLCCMEKDFFLYL